MQNEKAPSTDNAETNPVAGGENPWVKMPEEVPPFNGGEKQSADTSEIDISTEQGKLEWLYRNVEEQIAELEDKQDEIIEEEEYQKNQRSLEFVKRQNIILKNLDINGEGGVLGALERRRDSFNKIMNNPNRSQEANDTALEDLRATNNLHSVLSGEIALRDPGYFGQQEMDITLELEVAQAERQVEQTMLDAHYDEKGLLHKSPNGEKMPSTTTEDAEIDLKEAQQDVATFDLLMNDFRTQNDDNIPRAIRRADFVPTIDKFIEEHTSQIDQLLAESKTLAKGTPEYEENETKRKKLVSERSSARRILVKYFSENSQPAQEETHEEEQEARIDVVSVMDQMDADRDKYEKNLGAVERERQRRIEGEKAHHGYIEGEGRAPNSVLAAEEDANRIRGKITQKEKDASLLYRIYKENGKSQTLSKTEAKAIITRMIQERDAKMSSIDKELEKTEKKSERWKQLKQERAEAYRSVPDDAAERILELFK